MKAALTNENIENQKQLHAESGHFMEVIYPRLLALNNVRQSLAENDGLIWEFFYNPGQHHKNICIIRFKEQNDYFRMQYSIPLFHKFQLNLFFGIDTGSFFSVYHLLIEKEVIQKNEFPVSVGLNASPSLIINKDVVSYNEGILNELRNGNQKLADPAIKRILKESFVKYNPSLLKIIREKWEINEGILR